MEDIDLFICFLYTIGNILWKMNISEKLETKTEKQKKMYPW